MSDNKRNIDLDLPPLPKAPLPKIPPMPEAPSFMKDMGDKPKEVRREKPPLDGDMPVKSTTTEKKAESSSEKMSFEKKDAGLPPVMQDDTPAKAIKAAPMREEDPYADDSASKHDVIIEEYDGEIGEIDPKVALAPMTSNRERAQRELKEKIKMNDLQMEMEAPILDDLNDKYVAPEKKAKDLVEQDRLDRDEKMQLRRRVQEDLARVPENYNARQSKNMYNKLMEEKKLKTAKKGLALSVIPVLLGLIGAVICYFLLGWPDYEQIFQITAAFAAFGALLLLIKSNHGRLFGMTIYAISLIAYIGLGMIYYIYLVAMGTIAEYDLMHMVFGVAASACNIISLILLSKNEAIVTYYTTKFSKKR